MRRLQLHTCCGKRWLPRPGISGGCGVPRMYSVLLTELGLSLTHLCATYCLLTASEPSALQCPHRALPWAQVLVNQLSADCYSINTPLQLMDVESGVVTRHRVDISGAHKFQMAAYGRRSL